MRRVARPALVISTLLAAAATLSACGDGGGSSADDIRADVAEQIADQGYTQEQAECMADVVVDELGADAIEDVSFSAEDPEGLTDEVVEASLKAQEDCLPEG